MTAMANIDDQSSVRSRLACQRARIDQKQPLLRMAAMLDEWAKWTKAGGGLGLGYGKTAAHYESVTYCISDDEAVAIERCIATLKGMSESQGPKARECAQQLRAIVCHHRDGIALNALDIWLCCSRTTVQRRYWDGVGFVSEHFSLLRKNNC